MSKSNEELGFVGYTFGLIIGAAIMALVSIIYGVVALNLWQWFVVDNVSVASLHLKALDLRDAIGLGLVTGFFTHQFVHNDKDAKGYWTSLVSEVTLYPGMALLLGYIIHQF